MSNQQMRHFDRAADHFREAILVVQDVIYGVMGVLGLLLVAFNSVELSAHPREAGIPVAAGAVLIALAIVRRVLRRRDGTPRHNT